MTLEHAPRRLAPFSRSRWICICSLTRTPRVSHVRTQCLTSSSRKRRRTVQLQGPVLPCGHTALRFFDSEFASGFGAHAARLPHAKHWQAPLLPSTFILYGAPGRTSMRHVQLPRPRCTLRHLSSASCSGLARSDSPRARTLSLGCRLLPRPLPPLRTLVVRRSGSRKVQGYPGPRLSGCALPSPHPRPTNAALAIALAAFTRPRSFPCSNPGHTPSRSDLCEPIVQQGAWGQEPHHRHIAPGWYDTMDPFQYSNSNRHRVLASSRHSMRRACARGLVSCTGHLRLSGPGSSRAWGVSASTSTLS